MDSHFRCSNIIGAAHIFMAIKNASSLFILFIFLLIFPISSSASKVRILLLHHSRTSQESTLSSSMGLRTNNPTPRPQRAPSAAAAFTKTTTFGRHFRDAAHEVPSGPNPESN